MGCSTRKAAWVNCNKCRTILTIWREHESFVLRALKRPEILRIYEPWQPLADKTMQRLDELYTNHKAGLATFENVVLLHNMHMLTISFVCGKSANNSGMK